MLNKEIEKLLFEEEVVKEELVRDKKKCTNKIKKVKKCDICVGGEPIKIKRKKRFLKGLFDKLKKVF